MATAPQPGDEVPQEVRQELIDAVEAERRLFPGRILQGALDYARRYLGMPHPTIAALWDYILDCLHDPAIQLWYAQLDDYPWQFGYAMRNVDGRGLYIKLRFDDEAPPNVVVMSFHD